MLSQNLKQKVDYFNQKMDQVTRVLDVLSHVAFAEKYKAVEAIRNFADLMNEFAQWVDSLNQEEFQQLQENRDEHSH